MERNSFLFFFFLYYLHRCLTSLWAMIAILLVRLLSPFFLIIEVAAYFSCICVENIQVIQRIRIVFKM